MKKIKFILVFKIVTASMNLLAMDQESKIVMTPAPDNYPPDCCKIDNDYCYCDAKICCQKSARLFFKISSKISNFVFWCTGNSVTASQNCCDEN